MTLIEITLTDLDQALDDLGKKLEEKNDHPFPTETCKASRAVMNNFFEFADQHQDQAFPESLIKRCVETLKMSERSVTEFGKSAQTEQLREQSVRVSTSITNHLEILETLFRDGRKSAYNRLRENLEGMIQSTKS